MSGSFPQHPVLLVDDEQAVLASESRVLTAAGISNLITCIDPREVMALLARTPVSTVLLDISMPHLTGDVLLDRIRETHPDVPVIIVTASEDVNTAVGCMKAGAHDYMIKPVEPNRLVSGVRRAVDLWTLTRRYADLSRRLQADGLTHPEVFAGIVSQDQRMQSIFVLIESIAPTTESVLIAGETGTGKELVAEAIHTASGRKGELVTVNVAGLDDTMFSDTLFGHKKGAFTGADQARQGLVGQAAGGTLHLDEIGDLTPNSQVKLLRLIERGQYYQLGSDVVRTTDARFLVATHRDLTQMVRDGDFRQDLYFRLHTHEIRIPPLRERKNDLASLLDHFLQEASEELGKPRLAVPPELLTLMETYDFPGNIRELRSMIRDAVSRQKARMLSLQTFREAMGRTGEASTQLASPGEVVFPERLPTLKEIADLVVTEALSRAKGNQAIAAGMLGVTPQALSKRLTRRRTVDGS